MRRSWPDIIVSKASLPSGHTGCIYRKSSFLSFFPVAASACLPAGLFILSINDSTIIQLPK
jgi:hypothetical protein